MSTTLLKEIMGVRSLLDSPLDQSPTFEEIIEELEAEYQHVTNDLNDTGNAWNIDTYILETEVGTRQYRLQNTIKTGTTSSDGSVNITATDFTFEAADEGRTIYLNDVEYQIMEVTNSTTVIINEAYPSVDPGLITSVKEDLPDFYKPLAMTTVPITNGDPEYLIEFMEVEHMTKSWSWISTGKGQYTSSSHDSQLAAFYRVMGDFGEQKWVELRPIPNKVQSYKILYQVTDWWDKVFAQGAYRLFKPPHPSQRFYTRALAAHNLLYSGKVKWGTDDIQNLTKAKLTLDGLKVRLERYKEAYDEFKSSLDVPDVTYITPWADEMGIE